MRAIMTNSPNPMFKLVDALREAFDLAHSIYSDLGQSEEFGGLITQIHEECLVLYEGTDPYKDMDLYVEPFPNTFAERYCHLFLRMLYLRLYILLGDMKELCDTYEMRNEASGVAKRTGILSSLVSRIERMAKGSDIKQTLKVMILGL